MEHQEIRRSIMPVHWCIRTQSTCVKPQTNSVKHYHLHSSALVIFLQHIMMCTVLRSTPIYLFDAWSTSLETASVNYTNGASRAQSHWFDRDMVRMVRYRAVHHDVRCPIASSMTPVDFVGVMVHAHASRCPFLHSATEDTARLNMFLFSYTVSAENLALGVLLVEQTTQIPYSPPTLI
jgi:hypothetical protein